MILHSQFAGIVTVILTGSTTAFGPFDFFGILSFTSLLGIVPEVGSLVGVPSLLEH